MARVEALIRTGGLAALDGPGQVQIEKLAQLAKTLSSAGVQAESVDAETPAAFARAVAGLVDRVDAGVAEAAPARAMARDLFGFLAEGAGGTLAAIAASDGFPPEPDRAWEEGGSAVFWRLAALITDIWDHGCAPGMAERDAVIDRWLAALLPRRIYDFGAGAGRFAVPCLARGAEVAAIETNAVKRAFLRYRRARLGAAPRIHPSPRGGYDCALALDVLDHLRDPAAVVEALAARLGTGGVLLVQADFPDDGWHQGGETARDQAWRALIDRFRYLPGPRDPAEEAILMIRRAEVAGPVRPEAVVADTRIQLDPMATILPLDDGSGAWVIAARTFYARPMAVTEDGARLADLCRDGPDLATVARCMEDEGVEPPEVLAALKALAGARLLSFEQPGWKD